MKVSITIETEMGMTWPLWKRIVPELEAMGLATIFRSDHFPLGVPGVTNSLELITSLTYLAEHTRRVDFGTLVAPLSFHDPVALARQAMSLNDLSDGRMILGLGSGWVKSEHQVYGYTLGDIKTRLDRLEEGLEVITGLVRGEQPLTFQGKFYQLENARLLPRPKKPTRILIGGRGPKRTLPLVVRFADIWNCQPSSLETFRDLSAQLDKLLQTTGRQPADVKRSIMITVMVWRTSQEFERMLESLHHIPLFSKITAEGLSSIMASRNGIIGAPEQVVERMQAYSEAGVDEFVVQWMDPNDWTGLEILARDVLPHFT